ncbi:MAG: hypothetical protein ACXVJD_05890 [Mucilaginibacter sp.]
MKLFLFIICLSATIMACKKTDDPQRAGLTGTWELRHYSGTIAGVSKDLPPGNGTLMQFDADSAYKSFKNFKQDYQGKYKVVKKGISWNNLTYDALYFNGSESADYFIIKADSLTIGNTFADGVVSLYIKQKK